MYVYIYIYVCIYVFEHSSPSSELRGQLSIATSKNRSVVNTI